MVAKLCVGNFVFFLNLLHIKHRSMVVIPNLWAETKGGRSSHLQNSMISFLYFFCI